MFIVNALCTGDCRSVIFHDSLTTTSNKEISSKFTRKYEANASEFLEKKSI